MKRNFYIWALFMLGGVYSCVKPYDFDPGNYETILIIEARLSNVPGKQEVKITYSYPLDTILNETINEAVVWVEDQDGNATYYSNQENGVYLSSEGFSGTIGNTYQLHIEMPDGEEYVSEEETLNPPVEIDSIYGQYLQKASENSANNTGGIQFFIDSKESNQSFYRYEWTEAYKIVAPYPASHYVTADSMLVKMDSSTGICYKEGSSNELIYGTTNNSTVNRMVEFPVRYVSEETQYLRTRYTILVKQYSISQKAYIFYKQLDENNKSGGSLFDQQSGAVVGNITNVTNPDKNVVGFFEVAGVSEKRAYFEPIDLDERFNQSNFPYNCRPDQIITTTPDSAYYYVNETGGVIFYFSLMPPQIGIHARACTTCTFYADITPPSYWEE